METKYKHNETNEVVKITQDNGKFYTLNNGNSIVKDLFIKNYTMISVPTEVDVAANEWLNRPTPIIVEKQKQNPQLASAEVINSGNITPVDPTDFLNTPPPISGVDVFNKIDPNKIIYDDDKRGPVVRIIENNNTIQERPISEAERNRLIDEQRKKLANTNSAVKFIEETDDSAIDNFLQNGQTQQKRPPKILNENGLTEQEEYLRQEQITLNGVDPYKEKIAKYRAEHTDNQTQQINNQPSNVQSNVQNAQTNIQTNVNQQGNTIQQFEDPSNSIFKKIKRTYDINLNIDISEKIANPETLKILSDDIDGDIIQYYTNDILKTILGDTKKLYDDIYKQIHKIVYEGGTTKKTNKSTKKTTEQHEN